jgi:hypothetical protein
MEANSLIDFPRRHVGQIKRTDFDSIELSKLDGMPIVRILSEPRFEGALKSVASRLIAG